MCVSHVFLPQVMCRFSLLGARVPSRFSHFSQIHHFKFTQQHPSLSLSSPSYSFHIPILHHQYVSGGPRQLSASCHLPGLIEGLLQRLQPPFSHVFSNAFASARLHQRWPSRGCSCCPSCSSTFLPNKCAFLRQGTHQFCLLRGKV